MIFAKVDVELRDHERAAKAGSAMGTWLWALLWSRAKLKDGYVSREAIRGAFVGETQARKDMARLVAVGLAEEADGGWMLTSYAEKNETRDDVEKRQADQRRRKAKSREAWAAKASAQERVTDNNVTRDISVTDGVTDARVTGTREPEPEPEPEPDHRESARARAPTARGARIPADWSPTAETLDALRAEGHDDPARHLVEFRDYWRALPGNRGVKLDWEGTYRNWVRRAKTFSRGQSARAMTVQQPARPGEFRWQKAEVIT